MNGQPCSGHGLHWNHGLQPISAPTAPLSGHFGVPFESASTVPLPVGPPNFTSENALPELLSAPHKGDTALNLPHDFGTQSFQPHLSPLNTFEARPVQMPFISNVCGAPIPPFDPPSFNVLGTHVASPQSHLAFFPPITSDFIPQTWVGSQSLSDSANWAQAEWGNPLGLNEAHRFDAPPPSLGQAVPQGGSFQNPKPGLNMPPPLPWNGGLGEESAHNPPPPPFGGELGGSPTIPPPFPPGN